MAKLAALIVLLIMSIFVYMIWITYLQAQESQKVIDPPCSELRWMADYPQYRCKDYDYGKE